MADETDQLLDRLKTFVDATDYDTAALSDSLAAARAYIDAGIGDMFSTLAQPIQDDVTIAVAADLYGQRDARNGVMSVSTADQITPFRVSTDPLRAAWPKLRAAGILAGMGIA